MAEFPPTASRVYLPKSASPPRTILAFLVERFPNVDEATWRKRIARGRVTTADDGARISGDTPYRHGIHVLYYRDVSSEPATAEVEQIVYRDDEILVVDKPHGMVVTPGGSHVKRALLFRLQKSTGLAALAPMHRLDRDTAGLVLFAVKLESRGDYHRLFSEGTIEREYFAIAHVRARPDTSEWRVENRLEPGTPWYRQRIVAGPANALTRIELLELRDGLGLFRLRPGTGRKHQLRVHMASLGFPILGDRVYPEIRNSGQAELPLQLLAKRLAFTDPITGKQHAFVSSRKPPNRSRVSSGRFQ